MDRGIGREDIGSKPRLRLRPQLPARPKRMPTLWLFPPFQTTHRKLSIHVFGDYKDIIAHFYSCYRHCEEGISLTKQSHTALEIASSHSPFKARGLAMTVLSQSLALQQLHDLRRHFLRRTFDHLGMTCHHGRSHLLERINPALASPEGATFSIVAVCAIWRTLLMGA
jgi:hypothetical protein